MNRLQLLAALTVLVSGWVSGWPLLSGSSAAVASELKALRYNNPGLVVDLGVGLWAWPLPMDYDNDGDFDLVVSCPDKPSNGTYFFENPGGNTASPVFEPGVRIGPGHRNIRVSRVNGQPRVLVPGREFRDFKQKQFELAKKLPVPANYLSIHPERRKLRANQWHLLDYDGNGKMDIVAGIGDWSDYGWDDAWDSEGNWQNGPLRGLVYWFPDAGESSDGSAYEGRPRQIFAGNEPLEVYGWPSPNFADFDGDGDLDLLCGEFLDRFTYFENVGTRTEPEYADGRFLRDPDPDSPDGRGLLKMDLQMIVPTAIDWDRDGDTDLICGDEDGRVAFIEHTGEMKDGLPVFQPPSYFRQKADRIKCGALATPHCIDWDGDGDEDILSGNTAGYVVFYENLGIPDGDEMPRWAAPEKLRADGEVIRIQAGPSGSIQGPCEAKWGYTTFTAADWNHDGLPDIVLNSIRGEVLWYRNSGTRRDPKLEAARHVEVAWTGEPPKPSWTWWQPEDDQLVTQWRTTPVVADFSGDGLRDLAMLDHEGYLALFERTAAESAAQKGAAQDQVKDRSADDRPADDRPKEEREAAKPPELTLLPGRRIFVDVRGKPIKLSGGRAGRSGRRKLHAVDWDLDGDLDLLVNSVNADLLENMGEEDGEILLINRGPLDKRRLAGHTSSPTTARFFGNQRRDLLVGAEDGYLYLKRRD